VILKIKSEKLVNAFCDALCMGYAIAKIQDATDISQLVSYLTNEDEIIRKIAKEKFRELYRQSKFPKLCRQWKPWECYVMNLLDFRYWLCDCHYEPPYGKVISAWCRKHST
jgi:hypothetical protein